MDVDRLFQGLGGFGRFQLSALVLLSAARLPLPWNFLLHIFLSAVPPHHCRLPHPGPGNLSRAQRLRTSSPLQPDGTPSPCRMYPSPQLQLLYQPPHLDGQHNLSDTVRCTHGWEFDTSQFTSTIATEWDLVCERRRLNQAAGTFFFLGVTLGGPLFGYLSDRCGRRYVLLLGCLVTATFGTIASFSVGFTMFSITRLLSGVGLTAVSLTSITLAVEWTDVKHRALVGATCSLAWSVGNISLALIAYLLRDWRWLMLSVSAPCLLLAALCWWIPESARWLLAAGQTERALSELQRCARVNKVTTASCLSLEDLEKLVKTDRSQAHSSVCTLVNTPQMRRITIFSGIIWLGAAFSYYSISYTVGAFGLDIYLTHFIYGAIEVPGKLLAYLLLDTVGRRPAQGGFLLLTGLLMTLRQLIPKDVPVLLLLVGIIAKGSAEAAFTTAFLYTAELFPTPIRQSGLGYTSLMGRVGASLTPLVLLLDEFWDFLPHLIFISVTMVAGTVSFLLPETAHVPLPESIADIEARHQAAAAESGNDIPLRPLGNGEQHKAEGTAGSNGRAEGDGPADTVGAEGL
ncbi:solute carrier family 22 member 7-like [Pristis pectinata]|uniref:solute carrier family 22 member 7-like n=1 Tax=Pristis pectinata TaxID=685728 RepID=UPI00223E6C09|nr:solute carrier family 22 member 7-like [Pristis pectinata]